VTFEQSHATGRLENEQQILQAIETSLDSPEGKTPSMIAELQHEYRRTMLSIIALNNTENRTQAA
jgi:hypothetical protein